MKKDKLIEQYEKGEKKAAKGNQNAMHRTEMKIAKKMRFLEKNNPARADRVEAVIAKKKTTAKMLSILTQLPKPSVSTVAQENAIADIDASAQETARRAMVHNLRDEHRAQPGEDAAGLSNAFARMFPDTNVQEKREALRANAANSHVSGEDMQRLFGERSYEQDDLLTRAGQTIAEGINNMFGLK